ncbi:DNA polymerase [Musa troglodytarum]|uniref:DNA polymerase epsilon catalytic subunit n=1 Tax=Musa troglodytarum TaxID=320322 RepID=A0A9E7H1U2_9LILI|nr:DNA polymerase [Musa troglodytarum]
MNSDSRRWERLTSGRNPSKQKHRLNAEEVLERKLGFDLFTEGDKRLGWLLTFSPSSWEDQETNKIYSCVDLYFVSQDGLTFKVKHKFPPYFYAATKDKMELEVEAYLRRRYERQITDVEIVDKEDLDLKNHLSGLNRSYLKLSFDTVQQLIHVKNDLMHVVERNQSKLDAAEAFESIHIGGRKERPQDLMDCIIDLREYDVPYHVRFAIDNDVRCGLWYDISVFSAGILLEKRSDLLQRAEVHVCAFDIETTKLPLKFPDAEYDLIMMISYMIDGQGYLIINRECVGEDIEDLEYTPKPEFEGCFKVRNVKDEGELLKAWFAHMQEAKPELVEFGDGKTMPFLDLPKSEQQLKLKERLKKYCQKAYKRVLDKPVTELREAGICMRENPFYVDTVRSFRDRRYEYKGLNKVWKGKLADAKASRNQMNIQEAQDMVVLYDSLQLAHKCILNSFYGYVMRK